jgi:hypothetical protein
MASHLLVDVVISFADADVAADFDTPLAMTKGKSSLPPWDQSGYDERIKLVSLDYHRIRDS